MAQFFYTSIALIKAWIYGENGLNAEEYTFFSNTKVLGHHLNDLKILNIEDANCELAKCICLKFHS